jgi:hypothetical protein
MKHGLKVLTGLIFGAALMAVAPASATNYLTGTSGSIWTDLAGYGNGGPFNASNVPGTPANATFVPGAINYNSNVTGYTIGAFLNGAAITPATVGSVDMGAGTGNTFFQITGNVTLAAGNNPFNLVHDDGAVLSIAGLGTVFSEPGPTSAVTNIFNVVAPSAGSYAFTLDYVECCSPPAVLGLSVAPTPGPVPGAGLPGLAVLALVGGWAWVRKFA